MLRRILYSILAIGLLIAVIAAYIYIRSPATFPIKTIQVTGNYTHINQTDIENTVLPYTLGGFLNLNLTALQQALLTMPWLARADIRRVWPNKLIISLQQHVPIGYWNGKSLLSDQGIVFTPVSLSDVPTNLPQFVVADSDSQLVLSNYLLMNQQLASLQLSVVAVNLSARQAWTVTLNNGIILLLGREDLWNRLARFIDTYPRIINDKANKVVSVDLRYESGLALQWKGRAPPVV